MESRKLKINPPEQDQNWSYQRGSNNCIKTNCLSLMVILQGYVEVHPNFYKALIKFTNDKVCDLAP